MRVSSSPPSQGQVVSDAPSCFTLPRILIRTLAEPTAMFDPGTAQITPPSTHSVAAPPPCCRCEAGTVGEMEACPSLPSHSPSQSSPNGVVGTCCCGSGVDPPYACRLCSTRQLFSTSDSPRQAFATLSASTRRLPQALILRQFHLAPSWRPAGSGLFHDFCHPSQTSVPSLRMSALLLE